MTLFYIGETEVKINFSFIFCIALWIFSKNLIALFILIAVVLFHELAHALAAALLQKRTKSIELFPFGAAANIEGIEDFASSEIIIALAGPLFSLLSGFVCAELTQFVDIPFSQEFTRYSYAVAAFNFIPAYPLDGGRVLKCLLCYFFKKGKRLALIISVLISGALCVLSIMQAFNGKSGGFIVMGVFVLVAALKALKTPQNSFYRGKIINNSKSVFLVKAFCDENLLSVYQRLMGNKYNAIVVLDKSGRIIKLVDEIELQNAIMKEPLAEIGKI